LRLSIREVVGKIMDFPGVWMDRYESKNEAQAEAAKMIIGLSRAENSAIVAKVVESRGLGDRGAQAQVLETSVAEDEPVDFEGEESEDEDDISRHQKVPQLAHFRPVLARCHSKFSCGPVHASASLTWHNIHFYVYSKRSENK
jgi:hypothetical protein